MKFTIMAGISTIPSLYMAAFALPPNHEYLNLSHGVTH